MSIHGIGIDVGSVPRLAAITERYGEGVVSRWFDPSELGDKGSDPAVMAGCFSAKEAVWKALRIDERTPVPWRQIIITPHLRPSMMRVRLDGDLAASAAVLGVGRINVSITVRGDTAFAVAIAETAEASVSEPGTACDQAPGLPETPE